jgi:hypothetical protein
LFSCYGFGKDFSSFYFFKALYFTGEPEIADLDPESGAPLGFKGFEPFMFEIFY